MVIKLFNPFFWWRKRYSIKKRLAELPNDIRWRFILPFVKNGYIQNYDFEKIQLIKDKHLGKTAILLGNGPSVKVEDLEQMKEFVTFGCNRLHLAYDQMEFRPNYVLSSDEQMIADFGQEIIDNNNACFFVTKKRPFFKESYTWLKLKNGRPFKFSKDIANHVMGGGGTLIAALQIAYHMGIRKVFVYGIDHSFKYEKTAEHNYTNASGDDNHFIKNYRSNKPWQAPVMDLVEESFTKSDKTMRKEQGFIINITRGGKLEVLERKNIDEFLAHDV